MWLVNVWIQAVGPSDVNKIEVMETEKKHIIVIELTI